MNRPLGIGIIGAGNVLEAYLPQCDKLRARGLSELRVVCGRENQRGRAQLLGVREFVTSERLVLDRPDLDLIVILASMPEHGPLVRQALAAGKHVLVEKPLACDFNTAKSLVALAKSSDRQLVSAPFTTLSPTFLRMAALIQSGAVGRPALARGRYGWSGPWWSEWFYKAGGGCIFDLAVYPITTITGLLGPVVTVSASTAVIIPEREINGRKVLVEAEDTAQITLTFQNGAIATIMSGFTMQQYRSPAIEVYGTEGTIQMLGDDWDPEGFELWENKAGCWRFFKETQPDWPWTAGLPHLVEALHRGERCDLHPAHPLHVLEIMLCAQESARARRAIDVTSRFIPVKARAVETGEPAHLQHDRTREHVGTT